MMMSSGDSSNSMQWNEQKDNNEKIVNGLKFVNQEIIEVA